MFIKYLKLVCFKSNCKYADFFQIEKSVREFNAKIILILQVVTSYEHLKSF